MKFPAKNNFGLFAVTVLLLGLALTACNQPGAPASNASSGTNSSSDAGVKRYALKGKVVSVDDKGQMVNVDNEAIPGFMGAMTMPYSVKPASELAQLHAGDSINADVVVQTSDDKYWLENVTVTAPANPAAMAKPMTKK